jgi:hypothetical protein
MWETICAFLGLGLVVAVFGGLMYVCLFQAHECNYPWAARGLGLTMLAGATKVICLLLAEKVAPAFGSDMVNYVLATLAAVGMFAMMSGFASES